MAIKSDFAILDVKAGRGPLNKHFKNRPRMGMCPPELRVPVTITGYIDGVWGGDDGVSREFTVHVEAVDLHTEPTPTKKARKPKGRKP